MIKSRLCNLCNFPLMPGKTRCTACGATGINLTAGSVNEEEVISLADALKKRGEAPRRIKTGLRHVDQIFGGGIVITSTNLIGGAPGAGKTTLQLQISEAILRQSEYSLRVAVIVGNEQQPEEIGDFGERLKLSDDVMTRIKVVRAMGGLRSNLYELIKKYNPCIVFIDSLNKLVGEDHAQAIAVAGAVKNLIGEIRCGPAIMISQVTKDLDFAGPEKLQHEVDGAFMLDKDDVTGERMLFSIKNRNGEAPLHASFWMTERGLVEKKEEEE